MIKEAADAVVRGELIVFPTDTVFGIGCDPFNEDAIARLFAAKRRPTEKSIPVLVDSLESAHAVGDISPEAEVLLRAHWPGALTIVVPAKAPFPTNLSPDGTVALRQPNHDDLLELITANGGVLAATSANISGSEPYTTYDEAYAQFADTASVILPGTVTLGVASTVVDATTTAFSILRQGDITLSLE